jgi:hypothetical protein
MEPHMSRLVVAVAIVAVALAVAILLRRRRPAPPTQTRWEVPAQLDREDFSEPETPWLVAVFTSAACESCVRATAKAAVLAGPNVACQEVLYEVRPDLHERYAIDAVPTIVLADADGVVRVSFVGVPSATDLWAAVAESRKPGSSPEPRLGRLNREEPEGPVR